VQADGTFDETVRGILNLKRQGVLVEVRVVVHKQTYDRLPQLARFIARNLTFVDQVVWMGLEMRALLKPISTTSGSIRSITSRSSSKRCATCLPVELRHQSTIINFESPIAAYGLTPNSRLAIGKTSTCPSAMIAVSGITVQASFRRPIENIALIFGLSLWMRPDNSVAIIPRVATGYKSRLLKLYCWGGNRFKIQYLDWPSLPSRSWEKV